MTARPGGHAPDRRRDQRRAVLMRAYLLVGQHRLAVRLRNVSIGGARLSGAVPLAAGTSLHLFNVTLGQIPAVVSWSRGSEIGLTFLEMPPVMTARLAGFTRHHRLMRNER